jgi:hypothetical protein
VPPETDEIKVTVWLILTELGGAEQETLRVGDGVIPIPKTGLTS